ncbi:MAG: signal peptidase II [Clostridia bacterium]|nr:signal peptidase II [Clostridia bacterium]
MMYFLIALLLDQIVKCIVVATNCNISIIPNIFNIMYVQNTGGIYGALEGNNLLFIFISMTVLTLMVICSKFVTNDNKIKKVLWQLIIAGGVGNLIDRIFRGFVVDFVQLIFFGVFNLADVFIVISTVLIIFLELREFVSGNNREDNNRK